MTDGPFERDREALSPPWLGETGRTLARVQGRDQDDALALLKASVKLRWPATTADDALAELGFTRGLQQAPIESNAAFTARCVEAHDFWKWGGTPTAIDSVFAVYGYSTATCFVIPRHLADGVLGAPVAPAYAWHSQFIISLGPGYFQESGEVWTDDPDVVWDGTKLWGCTGTSYDLAWFRRQIRRYKSPGSYPVAIYLLGTLLHWDEGWFYDDGTFWGFAANEVIAIPLWPVWGQESIGLPQRLWTGEETWGARFDALTRPP